MTLEEIRSAFPGYHVEICLFPSGGSLTVDGCSECGTDDDRTETVFWGINRKAKTIESAVKRAQKMLGVEMTTEVP